MGLTAQRDVNASTEVSAIHAMDAAPVSMVGSDRAVERVNSLLVIQNNLHILQQAHEIIRFFITGLMSSQNTSRSKRKDSSV